MSNHESFLKMIGLEKEFDPPKEENSEKSDSKKESSWTALLPGSESHQTKTEDSSTESSPEVVSEDVAAIEPVAQDDWSVPENSNESLPETEPAPDVEAIPEVSESKSDSATEWDMANERSEVSPERTETYKPEETPTDRDSTEKTAVYSSVDRSRVSDNRTLTQTSSKAMTLSQALSTATGTAAGTAARTRKTVPFNYEGVEGEPSSDGTAHFDYSAQHSDYRIVTLEGRVNASAFHLGNLPLRLGRDPTNEVVLDDVNSSRFHAEIREQDGKLVVVDLGSTNGLKVNGEIITQKTLETHDVIQIGDCLFEFLSPGVLSKGKPQVAVFANETGEAPVSTSAPNRKKRIMVLAAGIVVVAVGYFIFGGGAQRIAESAKEVAAENAKAELNSIREELEKKNQKPISELNPEDVKAAFLKHLEGSNLLNLLPAEARTQLTNLPPEILQIFVADPDLLGQVIALGANQAAVSQVIKQKIGDYVVQKRNVDALALAEILLKVTPDDAGLKEARDRLEALVQSKSKEMGGYSEAEKKFYEYMEQHENFVMKLMDEKKYEDALKFSEVVAKNIGTLIEQDRNFQRVGGEEKEKWEQRARDLRVKVEESQSKAKESTKKQSEGNLIVGQIKEHLNFGEVGKANVLIDKFLADFPNHPARDEVVGLRAQLEAAVDRSYTATKSSIEQLLSTEAYENAWKELYRFSDLMPNHSQIKDLREMIEKKAGARAVQYYNQARVYEFEADDLVAAEQYYKRTLEVADPRSDLAKKAGRRYAEVKRRGIQ